MGLGSTSTAGKLGAVLLIAATLGLGWWKIQGDLGPSAPLKKARARSQPTSAARGVTDEAPVAAPRRDGSHDDAVSRYGSWDRSWSLRRIFVPRPSAPAAETTQGAEAPAAASGDAGSGADTSGEPPALLAQAAPPTHPQPSALPAASTHLPGHLVSVILVGREGRLAVVDSTVVEVGDDLAAGEIVQIHGRGIVVRVGTGFVDYVLGTPRAQPRGLGQHPGKPRGAWEELP